MLFNSLGYSIFLPIVFIIYWLLPSEKRWPFLLCSSYFFYMSWKPIYGLLILATSLVSFLAAIGIEKNQEIRRKKWLLRTAVFAEIAVLVVFKYLNFVLSNIENIFVLLGRETSSFALDIILPVGISFYTFQTMAYMLDVYNGRVYAEKHFGIYATFISFFPQLVAGPIERTSDLLPQIRSPKEFDEKLANTGIGLMLLGYFKKIVIADTISPYVDNVYNDLSNCSGGAILAAAILFSIQIYCDFSGYSDIAVGSANLLGIKLSTNFRSPYFSTSIKEFWSRWHISLSTWFRDYVYIPMGGNRCSKTKQFRNLLVTFALSGLWHGANWTYILWGTLHGLIQCFERSIVFIPQVKSSILNAIINNIRRISVFVFVTFAWIFFRASSIDNAIYAIKTIFMNIELSKSYLLSVPNEIGIVGNVRLVYILLLLSILFVIDYINYKKNLIDIMCEQTRAMRWAVCIVFCVIVALFSQKGVSAEFVYFQF